MNNQEDFFKSLMMPEKKRNGSTKNVIKKYLFHWPLFIISLAIALGLAIVYLNNYRPSYEAKASILIKDDKQDAGDPKAAVLNDIGITNSSEGVDNELEILKSKKLIGTVVQDLQLWVNYKKKNGLFFSDDLYKGSPVKLAAFDNGGTLGRGVLDIIINDDKTFFLKTGADKREELFFGTRYKSSFGTWRLDPAKNIGDFAGSNIKVIITDPESATVSYQNQIDASLSSKLATSVTLSINDKVAQRGKDILNSLIANYNSSSTVDKNQETKRTLDFLDQRLDSLSKDLTATEKGLENFKSSQGLTDISDESKIDLQNMQNNDNNLNEVNIKLNVVDGIDKYVNSNQASEKAPATLGIADPALSASIEKLQLLQLQHDKLAATLPETNPDFEPINNQIKATKAAISENVKNIKASLSGTKDKLESYNNKYESSIKNMPVQEREFVAIKRQQTSKESLYTYLLQKREEVSVKYASNLSNNRIVDQAYVEPVKDITMPAYFVALLIGLSLPAGLIYGRSSLSTKITTIDEINDVLKIPVVSELPYENTGSSMVLNGNSVSGISEQLRALRIKLHYLHNEREKGRVTMLTSSIPGEGKSFIGTNLAFALTLSFRKTVILELDMRKPKVAQAFGLSDDHLGISEYLNGKATKEDITQHIESMPNLDIISCGAIVNNPSELMEKKELKNLVLQLREEYDDIIIDSPPVHLVPDAVLLSRLADITLYVIRQGYTDKEELEFINRLTGQNQLQNVNIVFNGIERVKHGYGYKYDENYYNTKKNTLFSGVFGDFKSRF
jgi:tyrosine-protein kinase Etk/Wzc